MDGPKDQTGLEPEEVRIEEIRYDAAWEKKKKKSNSCPVVKEVSISLTYIYSSKKLYTFVGKELLMLPPVITKWEGLRLGEFVGSTWLILATWDPPYWLC